MFLTISQGCYVHYLKICFYFIACSSFLSLFVQFNPSLDLLLPDAASDLVFVFFSPMKVKPIYCHSEMKFLSNFDLFVGYTFRNFNTSLTTMSDINTSLTPAPFFIKPFLLVMKHYDFRHIHFHSQNGSHPEF